MGQFVVTSSEVIYKYQAEWGGNDWVWRELQETGAVTLSRTFTFARGDLVKEPEEAHAETGYEDFEYSFLFASRGGGYFNIDGRIFSIPNKVLIADTGLPLARKLFVAERGISIFRRISDLLAEEQEIVVGGARTGAIPIPSFLELLRKFPNTTEVNRYAAARIATVLSDYFDAMKGARDRYETYLTKTRSTLKDAPLRQPELLQTELEKYVLIRGTIEEWLREAERRSEADWQKMIVTFLLLIFPKYVAVLQNVYIKDFYSSDDEVTPRYIDIALVDASGNIDVIEVKKPFEHAILSQAAYRGNHVPGKELAGSIMQAEKYLFHLSKWGRIGEKTLSEKYASQLPPSMNIRITNPKAMIILGRDRGKDGKSVLNANQQLDLEVIKRKYANMMDIMTYDDLLRRLDNIISGLQKRIAEQAP